jgi:hypothetical protein
MRAALPYVNGTLTSVGGDDISADYDTPGSVGTPKWTGSAGIFVSEDLLEADSAGRVDLVVSTRLEIPASVGGRIEQGDQLSYTYDGAPFVRRANSITRTGSALHGRVRVILQNA